MVVIDVLKQADEVANIGVCLLVVRSLVKNLDERDDVPRRIDRRRDVEAVEGNQKVNQAVRIRIACWCKKFSLKQHRLDYDLR